MSIRLLDAGGAEALRGLVNGDAEFRLVSRDMNLNVSLEVGGEKRLFSFRDGRLHSIGKYVALAETIHVYIRGGADFWQKLLSAMPPPNFQNLYAGVRFKTCEVLGDSELYFAYFAALTRLVELMRDHQNA